MRSELLKKVASGGQQGRVMLLAVLVVGATGFWYWRQVEGGPAATAAGGLPASARNDTASSVAGEPTSGGPNPNQVPVSGSAAAPDPVAVWLDAPIILPTRDLFFSPSLVRPPPVARIPPSVQVDDEVEKRKTAAFRVAASDLKLTSVVGGSAAQSGNSAAPMALLNGRWVAPGDEVDGFRVVRIESTAVVVERDGRKLEVRMK
jgi:hypothetical protein